MQHTIRSKFDFADKVYFEGHDDPDGGFITGFAVMPSYGLKITVQWGPGMSHDHYEWELTKQSPDEDQGPDASPY